ncbi:MAG: hypothetical protein HC945_02490, partial [Nitrosarchaeum sp.]|nr:hypothetical protein [Nitrosarchaeum sp.]
REGRRKYELQKGSLAATRRKESESAEAQAEKIASATPAGTAVQHELAEDALNALGTPTKQCKRLATCIKKGVAFHHAGLASKQRELIEDAFRAGTISIICSTPTLAAGIDMPAYRAIIRDLTRYSGGWGMVSISVLEYLQMAGRAGRPGMEKEGEAITLATTHAREEEIAEHYIRGMPEEITSKLAAEPALRSAILSLIASTYCTTEEALLAFFERTFYAHHYGDLGKIRSIIERMLGNLQAWGFVERTDAQGDFVPANELQAGRVNATALGRRVSELYLDPYTAHFLITCLRTASNIGEHAFSYIHMLACTLEMRPLLRARPREIQDIEERVLPTSDTLYTKTPNIYDDDYQEFLDSLKTALFLQDWCEETTEDSLMDRYDVRPGEIHAKLERADWICYASEEICRLLSLKEPQRALAKLRVRLKHGAKEELFPLLKFKNIGRAGTQTLRQQRERCRRSAAHLAHRTHASCRTQNRAGSQAPSRRGDDFGTSQSA